MAAGIIVRGLTKSQLAKRLRSKLKGQSSKKKIPLKSDKRIEGSGAQSARPLGSIGKTKTADRPKGGTTGLSIPQAQRARGRKVATTAKGEPKTVKAKYDALTKTVHNAVRGFLMIGKKADASRALKASGVDLSLPQYIRILQKRSK